MTPKQTRFVAEYLANGMNATKAATAAGYSPKTAQAQGSRLLSNVIVAAAIKGKTKKMIERLEVTADLVLQEIAKMAFFDARRLFNSDGSLKLISEIDDHSAASIAGLEVCELFDGTGDQKHAYGLLKKVKLADRAKSLEMLGRYLKLFSADREDPANAITTLIIDL